MLIGVLRLRLGLPENGSLKDKRHAVKSILSRVRSQFQVSAAETDEQDTWQVAELGFAIVSNSARHADEVLAKVRDFVERGWPELPLLDVESETLQVM